MVLQSLVQVGSQDNRIGPVLDTLFKGFIQFFIYFIFIYFFFFFYNFNYIIYNI
jgi:hypothetical protein